MAGITNHDTNCLMEKKTCCTCQKPNPTLACGICKDSVCKNCAQFLEEGQFSFFSRPPEELKHNTFCGPCFDAKVAPQITKYDEIMNRAKGLTVFYTADSKRTRNFSRKEKPFKVKDCADREETLLRLAFLAVEANFNALIDVDIVSQKIRNGTYQTTQYSGTAIPVNLNLDKIR